MGSLLQSCVGLFSVVLYQPLRNFPHGSALPKSHDFLSISFTIKLNSLDLLWRRKKTQVRDQSIAFIMSSGIHSGRILSQPSLLFDWRWIWERLIEDAGCLNSAGRCVSIVLLGSWSHASLFVGRLFSETRDVLTVLCASWHCSCCFGLMSTSLDVKLAGACGNMFLTEIFFPLKLFLKF